MEAFLALKQYNECLLSNIQVLRNMSMVFSGQ